MNVYQFGRTIVLEKLVVKIYNKMSLDEKETKILNQILGKYKDKIK